MTRAFPLCARGQHSVGLSLALLVAAVGPLLAGPLERVPTKQQCMWQLAQGADDEIDCIHLAWLTEDEKSDLKTLTRGYLLDASCLITVKIDRAKVDAALVASDLVFESPQQPVTCEITTSRGPFTITATFSPRVVFKDGFAIEATPGLANIKGVNSYLAWPVVHYINYAERITKTMLLMINTYRANRSSIAGAAKP